jgi:hypothetical protein
LSIRNAQEMSENEQPGGVAEWPIASVLKSILAGGQVPSKPLETAYFLVFSHFSADSSKRVQTGRYWRLRLSRQPGLFPALGDPLRSFVLASGKNPSAAIDETMPVELGVFNLPSTNFPPVTSALPPRPKQLLVLFVESLVVPHDKLVYIGAHMRQLRNARFSLTILR